MFSNLPLLRTMYVVATLCLLAACKKHEYPWPEPPGNSCNCDVQRFESEAFQLRGYRFDKTYKADGSIDKIYLHAGGPASINEYTAYLRKAGNWIYLVHATSADTIFRAELNHKGRPIRSLIWDPVFGGFDPWQYYTYNAKGQLIRVKKFDNTGTYSFTYDQYGNTTSYVQDRDSTAVVTFTYDYTTPIKGAHYLIDAYPGSFLDLEVLQLLGYLPSVFSPRHKMLTAVNPYLYPEYNRSFVNQVIEDGYVTYYETTKWYGQDFLQNRTFFHCNDDQRDFGKY